MGSTGAVPSSGPRPSTAGPREPTSRPRRSLLGLLTACHPGATVAVTVLTTAFAAACGHTAGACALVAASVLTGQLSVGWSNDAVDAGRDTAAARAGKPIASGAVGAPTVWAASGAALALCAVLSLACGRLAGTVHLAGVASAWGYNLLLKSTALSWLPYAIGFASLPAFVSLALPGAPAPGWWIVTASALLGVGAHLADVLPDITGDLAAGVRGWPQRLGARRTRVLLPVPLVAATVLLAVGPPGPVGPAGVLATALASAVAAAGALAGRRRERVPFLAAVAVAAVDVVLLLGAGMHMA